MAAPQKISLAFGAKKQEGSRAVTPASGTKRPHTALYESDDEDNDEGKHEEVTHFDVSAGGAIDTLKLKAPKKQLVIPTPRKRQRSNLPNQNGEHTESKAVHRASKATITYGLNIIKKSADVNGKPYQNTDTNGSRGMPEGHVERSIDEQAMDSLLGKKVDTGMVISSRTEEGDSHDDYDHVPEAPSALDYDAVPFEEFGAAMLRGMGWKGEETLNNKPGQKPVKKPVVERRPDLLGVGAKSSQSLGIELGEWGKVAKKHEKRLRKNVVPVLLKNKKTGEMLTEEELKTKMQQQEDQQLIMEEEEKSHKAGRRLEYRTAKSSRRNDEKESRSGRDNRQDRDREYDDRKHGSSRRHRSTSVDSQRRRNNDRHEHDSKDRRRVEGSPSRGHTRRKEDEDEKRAHDRDHKHRERSSSADGRHKSRKRDHRYRGDQDNYCNVEKSSRRDRSDRDYGRSRDL